MRNLKTLVCLGAALALSQAANAITLDFANVVGGKVQMQGNSLSFVNAVSGAAAGYSFQIGNVTGGSEDSLGNYGRIDGNFNIGAITISGTTQTADVTGLGIVYINDGLLNLTGTIDWKMIKTEGTSSSLNLMGVLNFTDIKYTGTEQDLIDLAKAGVGSETLNFTFASGKSLTELTSGTTYRTTFSGSIEGSPTAQSVPDGGSTLALLGGSIITMVTLRRKIKALVS